MNRLGLIQGFPQAIKIGLWLIPLLPLYIPSLLYPFTTGRNFAFRIFVEIVFAFWIVLAATDRSYRPRRSNLLSAVSLFLLVVLIADIFSPNPWRAFFSDYERMGGFISLFHYYLYFLVLCSVFRRVLDWSIFFLSSIATSALISFIALLHSWDVSLIIPGILTLAPPGIRATSTTGNAAYLAGYLLLHTWLALLFIVQNWGQRITMATIGTALALCLTGVVLTGTRSAMLSLALSSIFIGALSVSWRHIVCYVKRKKTRVTASLLVIVFAIAIVVITFKDHNTSESSGSLSRLINNSATDYSAAGTINTRFIIWNMALKGIIERPVLGWGHENFYLVFQKYFDPRLHDKEQYFDRAHNIVLDWLIHAGIIGFLSYVVVWIIAIKTLIASVRVGKLPLRDGYLIGALLLSYLLHNSFHFDTFNTSFIFFSVLAYIQFRAGHKESLESVREEYTGRTYLVGVLVAFTLIVVIYWANIKPIQEVMALTRAVTMSKSARKADSVNVEELYESFVRALANDTLGAGDADELLVKEVSLLADSPHLSGSDKKRFVKLALSLLKKTENSSTDIRHLLMFAVLLNTADTLDEQYSLILEKILHEALQLSPKKQTIYFELAHLHLNTGAKTTALHTLKKAWELEPRYTDAAANLLTISISLQRKDIIDEIENIIPLEQWNGGHLERIGIAYRRMENHGAALRIYRRLIELQPTSSDPHFWCGVSLVRLQRLNAARIYFEETLRLGEKQQEAQRFLDLIDNSSLTR